MKELQVFENTEFGKVRTLVKDGDPWFVGKDVAEILGYQNASKALIDHVDDEDKLNNESLSSLGQRGGWLINESGVYSLVFASKLPTAKKFKRWVTSEVLPTLRKTGTYSVPSYQIENPIERAEKWIEEYKERQTLQQRVEEMRPKELFADAVSASKTSILIGDLAKILKGNGIDIGQRRLFQWLRQHGYLMKTGSSYNMPTQKAMELKLFEVKESTVTNPDGSIRISKTTKVTGKGQQYFINKFLKGVAVA